MYGYVERKFYFVCEVGMCMDYIYVFGQLVYDGNGWVEVDDIGEG